MNDDAPMIHRSHYWIPVVLAALSVALAAQDRPSPPPADERKKWLREHSIPVRTLAFDAKDDADLEALVPILKDVRVVQLGENSHGAGAAFAAKARLIRFLHRRLGFDVLVWESGMYGCRAVDRALRAGANLKEAVALGIGGNWSPMKEVAPLLRYAQASHDSERPLLMAGFDLQFGGLDAAERLRHELKAALAALADREAREEGLRSADAAFDAYAALERKRTASANKVAELRAQGLAGRELGRAFSQWQRAWQAEHGLTDEDLQRFKSAFRELVAFLERSNDALARVHGRREAAFLRRCVDNLAVVGVTVWEGNKNTPKEERRALGNRGWNRRDTRNAANLLWLANEHFKGHKLIVWAHNGHLMNCWFRADWKAIAHEPQPGGMEPMGVAVKKALGNEVYTLGFTAFAGKQRPHGGSGVQVGPAPPGSLEHDLHGLGRAQLILDLRQVRGQDRWLGRPYKMAIRGYMSEEMDWSRVVDGIFFNDVMTPSTPVR